VIVIDIECRCSAHGVTFSLSRSDGAPVYVVLLSVSPEQGNSPVWQFAPHDATIEISGGAQLEPVQVDGESPSFAQDLEDAGVAYGVPLTEVSYGSLPPGCQQIFPKGLAPPSLQPEVGYRVLVVGNGFGSSLFGLSA
jgi:hypothetical protein